MGGNFHGYVVAQECLRRFFGISEPDKITFRETSNRTPPNEEPEDWGESGIPISVPETVPIEIDPSDVPDSPPPANIPGFSLE